MGYDRGDSFPLDFEPNRIPFGSISKGKLPPRSYPIQCERNWKYSFLSVAALELLIVGSAHESRLSMHNGGQIEETYLILSLKHLVSYCCDVGRFQGALFNTQ